MPPRMVAFLLPASLARTSDALPRPSTRSRVKCLHYYQPTFLYDQATCDFGMDCIAVPLVLSFRVEKATWHHVGSSISGGVYSKRVMRISNFQYRFFTCSIFSGVEWSDALLFTVFTLELPTVRLHIPRVVGHVKLNPSSSDMPIIAQNGIASTSLRITMLVSVGSASQSRGMYMMPGFLNHLGTIQCDALFCSNYFYQMHAYSFAVITAHKQRRHEKKMSAHDHYSTCLYPAIHGSLAVLHARIAKTLIASAIRCLVCVTNREISSLPARKTPGNAWPIPWRTAGNRQGYERWKHLVLINMC
jgi:hypothetical protein